MKKLMYRCSGVVASALVFFATFGASINCWFTHYQPQVPKSLRK